MGDLVALNAACRVAQQDVPGRELAEEGPVALAHHDRHQVDGHLVEQPQLEALPGDGASGDRDDAVSGELLCSCDRAPRGGRRDRRAPRARRRRRTTTAAGPEDLVVRDSTIGWLGLTADTRAVP